MGLSDKKLRLILASIVFFITGTAVAQVQYRQIQQPLPVYAGQAGGQISALSYQVPSQSVFQVNPNSVSTWNIQNSMLATNTQTNQLIYAPNWSNARIQQFNSGQYVMPYNNLMSSPLVTMAMIMALKKNSLERDRARWEARERREERRAERSFRRRERDHDSFGFAGIYAYGSLMAGAGGPIDPGPTGPGPVKTTSFNLDVKGEKGKLSIKGSLRRGVEPGGQEQTGPGTEEQTGGGNGAQTGTGNERQAVAGNEGQTGTGNKERTGTSIEGQAGADGAAGGHTDTPNSSKKGQTEAGFLPSSKTTRKEVSSSTTGSSTDPSAKLTPNSFMRILKGKGLFDKNKFMCEKSSVDQCKDISPDLQEVSPTRFSAIRNAAQRRDAFVEWLKPAAQYWGMITGIPPSLIVAQAVHETGSGSSRRFQRDNNLFSIYCGKVGAMETSIGKISVDRVSCNGSGEAGHSGKMSTPKNFSHALKHYLAYLTSKMKRVYPTLNKAVKEAKAKGPLEMADVDDLLKVRGHEKVKCGGQFVTRPKYALTAYACNPKTRDALESTVKKYKNIDTVACKECVKEKINGAAGEPTKSEPAKKPELKLAPKPEPRIGRAHTVAT